ncbi:M28 family peptidase [Metabacillus sp. KIGAM252]|uniref:M28 family peptidase n=1 Tax=Metabacillus flavus TaxID=2823519 RepID=A0ABS5LCG2_9BACI|nr:M28 family peptidase [Metabacillus flavus]MBS2968424.1 M28 family peptidase [Metabacillus flavus]
MKKPILTSLLAATLALSAAGTQTAFAKPAEQTYELNVTEKKILKKIDAEKIYSTIAELSKTPRVAGTESEWKAVQYVKKKFESYGYKTKIQPFTFEGYTAPTKIELTVGSESFKPGSFTYTVGGKVSGELVLTGLGKKEELLNTDLTGKIALIKRGEISFAEKVLNAAEKGAAGVIIYNNSTGALSGTLGAASDKYIPAVALTKAEGEALAAKISGGEPLKADLNVEGGKVETRTSHNVIATKKPVVSKDKNSDVIVIGAHHDSVEGAPGANDDASGTAMTLEMARIYQNVPTDTELRFVTFGAEEVGLLGSYHYVENLSDDEISRTIANFNLDMVGSKDAGDLVMLTLDGKSNLVTELAQNKSEKLNGEATPFGQGGRSDHVPFAEAGIPAALFIHNPTEPWYHNPQDTIDKISKDKLQDVAEIISTSVYERARLDIKWPKIFNGPKVKAAPEMVQEQELN